MFFMIGVSEGSKEFDHTQNVICPNCGRYGRDIVFMTYTVLSLFFIPCFKWNKQYFVRMSCCGKIYRLDPEVGKRIAKGEEVEILPSDLEAVDLGWQGTYSGWNDGGSQNSDGFQDDSISRRANWNGASKTCSNCGYQADADFDYCPKCGTKLP